MRRNLHLTFPYPKWVRTAAFLLIPWGVFSFLRKYYLFDLVDPEMFLAPVSIAMVLLYFAKSRKDDERIHYLKFQALAFAVLQGLWLTWIVVKVTRNWQYSVHTDLVYPVPASLFIIISISTAYLRLKYLQKRL
jgi:hypothetical protein